MLLPVAALMHVGVKEGQNTVRTVLTTTLYICALVFQSIFEAIRERMGIEVWIK